MLPSSSTGPHAKKPKKTLSLRQVVTEARTSTDSELARILEAVSAVETSWGRARKDLGAARSERYDAIKTILPVELESGGAWDWSLCHPNHLLTSTLMPRSCNT